MHQSNFNRQQTIANFEKFCAFITSEHDIEVCTGQELQPFTNGKQIYVPDISGMTPKQIRFVYSSVLHEVGHILHTDFSEEYFSQLFNFLIASIANVLEDCREESLLCDEFAGATEILEDTAKWMISQDAEILELYVPRNEIANIDYQNIGFFDIFTSWLYTFAHRKVSVDEDFFAIHGIKYAQLCQFLKKTNFRSRFKDLKNSLYCQDDVLIFSEQIYNLLVQEFPEESKNYKFHNLENFFKTKEVALKYFAHTKKEVTGFVENVQKDEIEILQMEADALKLQSSIIAANSENENKIAQLNFDISQKQKKIFSVEKFLSIKDSPDNHENQITTSLENISDNKGKIRELETRQKNASKELSKLQKDLAAFERYT